MQEVQERERRVGRGAARAGGSAHLCPLLGGVNPRCPSARTGRYCRKLCIGNFAIQLYGGLLQERDHKFPRWCFGSVFLPPHDKVKLAKSGAVRPTIWGMIQKHMRPSLRYVFMPLHDATGFHWLLLAADLRERCYCVYDSMSAQRDVERGTLVTNVKVALGLSLMRWSTDVVPLQWEIRHAVWPQQDKLRGGSVGYCDEDVLFGS